MSGALAEKLARLNRQRIDEKSTSLSVPQPSEPLQHRENTFQGLLPAAPDWYKAKRDDLLVERVNKSYETAIAQLRANRKAKAEADQKEENMKERRAQIAFKDAEREKQRLIQLEQKAREKAEKAKLKQKICKKVFVEKMKADLISNIESKVLQLGEDKRREVELLCVIQESRKNEISKAAKVKYKKPKSPPPKEMLPLEYASDQESREGDGDDTDFDEVEMDYVNGNNYANSHTTPGRKGRKGDKNRQGTRKQNEGKNSPPKKARPMVLAVGSKPDIKVEPVLATNTTLPIDQFTFSERRSTTPSKSRIVKKMEKQLKEHPFHYRPPSIIFDDFGEEQKN